MNFTRREQIILDTFGLRWEDAEKHLEANCIKMKRTTWFKQKKKLEEKSINVLFETARNFHARHLNRVNVLRYLLDKSFENLDAEPDPLKRQRIIDSIKELQYDIATFDEATRDLIEYEMGKEEASLQVSEQ